MKVTIGFQRFNILVCHRIAILQYIANNLFLQRTLTVDEFFCMLVLSCYLWDGPYSNIVLAEIKQFSLHLVTAIGFAGGETAGVDLYNPIITINISID